MASIFALYSSQAEWLFEAERVSRSIRDQSTSSSGELSNLCFSVAELVDAPHC